MLAERSQSSMLFISPPRYLANTGLITCAMVGGSHRPPTAFTVRKERMAERWQQWMPFHIDRWRGSPSVNAMHPSAQMGYLNLLCSCWQSPDCSLPDDPIDLATESRLGDELWALYGPRIVRKFSLVSGRWQNGVLFEEWSEAKAVFERNRKARSEAGKIGNAIRWGRKSDDSDPKQIAKTSQNIATLTGTLTGTGTTTNTLALTSIEVPASPAVFTFKLTGKKTHVITAQDIGAYREAYPGIDVTAELRKIPPWLDANPEKRSANVNGSKQRIVKWLSRSQNQISINGGSNGRSTDGGYSKYMETLERGERAFPASPSQGSKRPS